MTGLKLFTSYKVMTGIKRFLFSYVYHLDKSRRTNIKTEEKTKEPETELTRP